MACCGKGAGSAGGARSHPNRGGGSGSGTSAMTYFRNAGTAGITAMGPVSRRIYRFPAGMAVAVDAQDAASLSRVPNLRAVR